ncbi:HD domain-containing protein [Vibrio nitrifigilis]|uniref:HD domain-containing protein n=1 Tax=Vibrio nitrifigilis TaxID=2789781 RepID=A0ABS0GJ76_9VIBR|nr:HD domain-containing protein [Vibrio nitrifigilis]MBF9002486.1 HD domain-containing protein [Vibrio nitrifigilis]
MNFEKHLNGKILDPIHGTIRITEIERQVIGHSLFQRLRGVKQNTFLYKVFPSAMHSRFEHSLGVMHVAYKMFVNLIINSYRYDSKYHDKLIFKYIDEIEDKNIQELRLAALLHDVGHGPMSHQFDSFLLNKEQLISVLGPKFHDVYELIDSDGKVEHEHISVIFIRKIFDDLNLNGKVNVDNVIKLIELNYKYEGIFIINKGHKFDIQPLFTSLISSCPIDSDRMDYLLRDSYFSGVKCGIYNVERILMSIVPVTEKGKVYLAYKESCLDSISEFIFSRSSLFSQVYYHKTNRAFSSMLTKVCEYVKELNGGDLSQKLYGFESGIDNYNLDSLVEFYLDNSDDYFINKTVPKLIEDNSCAEDLVNNIVKRVPWKKLYETKLIYSNKSIKDSVDKALIANIKLKFNDEIGKFIKEKDYIIDIMTDNAFKDVNKTEIKLLIKRPDGHYQSKDIIDCGCKLNAYQSIKYFVRVFINPDRLPDSRKELSSNLEDIKNALVGEKLVITIRPEMENK